MKKNTAKTNRTAERGGANVKFMLVVLVLAIAVNAGYHYIPTAYQGENYKQEMQTAVVQALAMPLSGGNPAEVLKAKLGRIAADSQLPPALIDVRQLNNVLTAHVKYSKEVNIVPFGIYNYRYEFDHTATPSGFLMRDN